jgi:anti-sigma-K factor RskA
MTDHVYWDELAAGYALHGLSPEEEVLFADHLENCDVCAASVNDLELVAAQLGSMAHYREDDDAPSWESMRSAIISTPQNGASAIDDLAARRHRRYEISRRSLAAAAAVVAVAGGGIATWQLTSGGSSCSASGGCHAIELDAAGGKSAATIEIRGQTVIMNTSAMAAAPPGKVYVLWQLPSDRPATPIKEFAAGSGAASSVTASLEAPYSDTQGFAVSIESAGTAPTKPHGQVASGTTT